VDQFIRLIVPLVSPYTRAYVCRVRFDRFAPGPGANKSKQIETNQTIRNNSIISVHRCSLTSSRSRQVVNVRYVSSVDFDVVVTYFSVTVSAQGLGAGHF